MNIRRPSIKDADGNLLTQGGTMTAKEHYRICTQEGRYVLAGNDCCDWHKKMPRKWRIERRGW